MKKIVAFLLPVSAEDSPKPSGAAVKPIDTQNCEVHDEHTAGDGAMKLEAIVSDSRAQRVIAALLEHEDEIEEESNLERLLRREIDVAGPDAQDLFKRIVIAVERELIGRVYSECNGVKTRAAARLGIDRNTLHKKLRQHHLADE